MASRKRANQEKQSHGQRTNDALQSITPSNNLNAQLLIKPQTKLPFSKFSQRFKTAGTRNPIKRDTLEKPNVKQTKFKPEPLPKLVNRVDPRTFKSASLAKGPGKGIVQYTPPGAKSPINVRLADPRDLATVQRNQSQALASEVARAAAESRNTAKQRSLASEVSEYNKAIGSRGGGRRGATGANGVL
tara:strand:- start:235 stop:798 length:564 start_codon:yes stop_codon:yes gene_type:complete